MFKLMDDEQAARKALFAYFGYVEDWRILPLEDCTKYYWQLHGGEAHGGVVEYADLKVELTDSGTGDYYQNDIYTNRFLPKWVYRGPEYTMIVVDTHTDGNKLLQVFTNDKEKIKS